MEFKEQPALERSVIFKLIICGRSVKVTPRCRSGWSGEAAAVAAVCTKEDTSMSCWITQSLSVLMGSK
jgi:hypothetical protein